MKTVFLVFLIAIHGLSRAFAQQETIGLDAASVFSSQDMLSACRAISNGEHLDLPKLTHTTIDINQPGKHGCTLLLWCWCNGYHLAFEVLLEMGADPQATIDSDISVHVGRNRLTLNAGASVAAIAIRFSRVQPQFVEKVVRYMRDANQRDASGGTLLHSLMDSADDQAMVRVLSDADHREPESSAQPWSTRPGSQNGLLVQTTPFLLLYQSGVQVDVVDNSGMTALLQYMHWLEHLDVQLDRVDVATSKAIGLFGHTEYFQDIDRRTKFIAVLERIVKKPQSMRLCKSYLEAFKRTPQSYYESQNAETRSVPAVDYGQFLFNNMYSHNLHEKVSQALQEIPFSTPMDEVISFNRTRDNSFDVNAQGKAGFSLLFAACLAKNEAGFQELLELGADLDSRLKDDLWPFVLPSIQSSAGAAFCPERGETVLLSAALNPDGAPYIRLGIKSSDEIDIRDNLNRNMLHRILYHRLAANHAPLVTELVQAGVDLNAQSIGGATPCHEAVFRNAAIIPELVRLGADPHIQDLQGRSVKDVLRLSIEQKWTFHEESIKALEVLERKPK